MMKGSSSGAQPASARQNSCSFHPSCRVRNRAWSGQPFTALAPHPAWRGAGAWQCAGAQPPSLVRMASSGPVTVGDDEECAPPDPSLDSACIQLPKVALDDADENQAMVPGHFMRKLQQGLFLDENREVTPLGKVQLLIGRSYLNYSINWLLVKSRRWQTVLGILRDTLQLCDAVNLSTAMHKLGKLFRHNHEASMAQSYHGKRATPHSCFQHPTYRELVLQLHHFASQSDGRSIANTIWGLAALNDTSAAAEALVRKLNNRLLHLPLDQFSSQEISNILWGTVKLKMNDPRVFAHMLKQVTLTIDDFSTQGLSNIVWACAVLRHRDPEFLAAIERRTMALLTEMRTQSIANIAWSCSVLEYTPVRLCAALSKEVVSRLARPSQAEEFSAQDLTNLLLCFSRAGLASPPMLSAIEREIVAQRPGFSGLPINRLEGFTSQGLCNALWSFGVQRWYPSLSMDAMLQYITLSIADISDMELVLTLLAHQPGDLMLRFLDELVKRAASLDLQACCNGLWSIGVLQSTESEAFLRLLARFIELEERERLSVLQCNQVLQSVTLALCEQRAQRSDSPWRLGKHFTPAVLKACLQRWSAKVQSERSSTTLSRFHLVVSTLLQQLGIEHQLEHCVIKPGVHVDIAILRPSGERLAVEVDGPHHYPFNSFAPLGHTWVRRRVLRACGWKVLSVPFWAWEQRHTWEERARYLGRALVAVDPSFAEELRPSIGDLLLDQDPGAEAEEGLDPARSLGDAPRPPDQEAAGRPPPFGEHGHGPPPPPRVDPDAIATTPSALYPYQMLVDTAGMFRVNHQTVPAWGRGGVELAAGPWSEDAAQASDPLAALLAKQDLSLTQGAYRSLLNMGIAQKLEGGWAAAAAAAAETERRRGSAGGGGEWGDVDVARPPGGDDVEGRRPARGESSDGKRPARGGDGAEIKRLERGERTRPLPNLANGRARVAARPDKAPAQNVWRTGNGPQAAPPRPKDRGAPPPPTPVAIRPPAPAALPRSAPSSPRPSAPNVPETPAPDSRLRPGPSDPPTPTPSGALTPAPEAAAPVERPWIKSSPGPALFKATRKAKKLPNRPPPPPPDPTNETSSAEPASTTLAPRGSPPSREPEARPAHEGKALEEATPWHLPIRMPGARASEVGTPELRTLCVRFGLPSNGGREELTQRLLSRVNPEEEEREEEERTRRRAAWRSDKTVNRVMGPYGRAS
ncbi:hypothetical protein ACKKBF_B20085 [Auxenochlorella protothecoides x Auxenochlorella symbiontica]